MAAKMAAKYEFTIYKLLRSSDIAGTTQYWFGNIYNDEEVSAEYKKNHMIIGEFCIRISLKMGVSEYLWMGVVKEIIYHIYQLNVALSYIM